MVKRFDKESGLLKRSFLSPSCSNLNCFNYAKTDIAYPRAGRTKQGKQRYRCNTCEVTFTLPPIPDDRFKINQFVKTQEPKNSQTPQYTPENVTFSLSAKAVEGLYKLSSSFGWDCNEMLEQIGQGDFVLLRRSKS